MQFQLSQASPVKSIVRRSYNVNVRLADSETLDTSTTKIASNIIKMGFKKAPDKIELLIRNEWKVIKESLNQSINSDTRFNFLRELYEKLSLEPSRVDSIIRNKGINQLTIKKIAIPISQDLSRLLSGLKSTNSPQRVVALKENEIVHKLEKIKNFMQEYYNRDTLFDPEKLEAVVVQEIRQLMEDYGVPKKSIADADCLVHTREIINELYKLINTVNLTLNHVDALSVTKVENETAIRPLNLKTDNSKVNWGTPNFKNFAGLSVNQVETKLHKITSVINTLSPGSRDALFRDTLREIAKDFGIEAGSINIIDVKIRRELLIGQLSQIIYNTHNSYAAVVPDEFATIFELASAPEEHNETKDEPISLKSNGKANNDSDQFIRFSGMTLDEIQTELSNISSLSDVLSAGGSKRDIVRAFKRVATAHGVSINGDNLINNLDEITSQLSTVIAKAHLEELSRSRDVIVHQKLNQSNSDSSTNKSEKENKNKNPRSNKTIPNVVIQEGKWIISKLRENVSNGSLAEEELPPEISRVIGNLAKEYNKTYKMMEIILSETSY
jgi:hypothetical protein